MNENRIPFATLKRTVTLYPAHPHQKIAPALYEKGYAREKRLIKGEEREVVYIDSIASQANRAEEALETLREDGRIYFPRIWLELHNLPPTASLYPYLTDLRLPNRAYDAWLSYAVDASGQSYKATAVGQALAQASPLNATPLLQYSPSTLIFGAWDSFEVLRKDTRFPRAVISEIVGVSPRAGVRISGRSSPIKILKDTFGKEEKRASELGVGQIKPTINEDFGGVTVEYLMWNTVISAAPFKRLRFLLPDGGFDAQFEAIARKSLFVLALIAVLAQGQDNLFLRSGCELVPTRSELNSFSVVSPHDDRTISISLEDAIAEHLALVDALAAYGVDWRKDPVLRLQLREDVAEKIRNELQNED